MKHFHYLQHEPFEGPGYIAEYCRKNNILLSGTQLFNGEQPPADLDSVDLLIVLGGSMSVNDPIGWLADEKKYIEQYIKKEKPILGICLGAQLIANLLGSRVYKNEFREIGWYPLKKTPEADTTDLDLPDQFYAFHWHGETFDLPHGSTLLAYSAACENQAFLYGSRMLGLQFHLETTQDNIDLLIKYASNELDGSRYVQSIEEIRSANRLNESNKLMSRVLDFMMR